MIAQMRKPAWVGTSPYALRGIMDCFALNAAGKLKMELYLQEAQAVSVECALLKEPRSALYF